MTVPLGGMIDGNLMESMASLSMLQRVSTGYVVLDILLCALIPVILQKIKPYAQELWRWLSADADTAKFTRHVKFVKREGYYHYDPAEKNHLLQEAILTYIGSQEHLVQKFSVRSRERLLHNDLCTHHSHGFACNPVLPRVCLAVHPRRDSAIDAQCSHGLRPQCRLATSKYSRGQRSQCASLRAVSMTMTAMMTATPVAQTWTACS